MKESVAFNFPRKVKAFQNYSTHNYVFSIPDGVEIEGHDTYVTCNVMLYYLVDAYVCEVPYVCIRMYVCVWWQGVYAYVCLYVCVMCV